MQKAPHRRGLLQHIHLQAISELLKDRGSRRKAETTPSSVIRSKPAGALLRDV